MSSESTESTESTCECLDKIKEMSRTKKWIVSTSCVILIIVVVGITIELVRELTQSSDGIQKLRSVLPESFSAEYSVQYAGEESMVEIEWDINTNDFRYREISRTQEETLRAMMADHLSPAFENDTLMHIANVDNEGVLNLFDARRNEWTWSCIGDVEDPQFIRALRYATQASMTDKGNWLECNGNVWSYSREFSDCSTIYYCVNYGSIAAIKENNLTARLLPRKWTVPATNVIQLPEKTASCIEILRQIYISNAIDEITAVGNVNKHRYSPYKKTCLFIHGAGEEGPKTGYNVETSQKDYWGNVETYVSRCATKKFIHFDTINRGWDDADLQRSFCSFATSPDDRTYISNKIIYAHSMGNLIIAAALHHDVCKFGNTTEWYSVQGPWLGSRVADWLEDGCMQRSDVPLGLLDPALLLNFLQFRHYCTSRGTLSRAYETLKTTYKSPDGTAFYDLISVGKKYVSGILCGDSSWGMGKNWLYSAAWFAIQHGARQSRASDGMATFDFSCAMGNVGRFSTKYKNRFYLSEANHDEGTCRFGDADFCHTSEQERFYPCRWYQYS